ncbi:hypothetical protein HOY82DRAFT_469304, partial [Tuber indicum]
QSAKFVVLESMLDSYLMTIPTIPALLSCGPNLPFMWYFILHKTSEPTDSLPDKFWDSRHGLGLTGYYDVVGHGLNVDVCIQQLNTKLGYTCCIVEVLTERLRERH